MTENDLDFVLDGNAAAGALREVFAADVTSRPYSMRRMRLGRSGGFSALLCGPDGSRAEVQQLCGHPSEGGPHAAWSLAGNEGRAPPQSCSSLRPRRFREKRRKGRHFRVRFERFQSGFLRQAISESDRAF